MKIKDLKFIHEMMSEIVFKLIPVPPLHQKKKSVVFLHTDHKYFKISLIITPKISNT